MGLPKTHIEHYLRKDTKQSREPLGTLFAGKATSKARDGVLLAD